MLMVVIMVGGFCLASWGLRAVLCFILSSELLLLLRAADKALRVWAVVFVAPVSLGLEIRGQRYVTLRADCFRNAVLAAPPFAMDMVGVVVG